MSSSPSSLPSVVIVGAGIVGLSIAARLLRAGCGVELFDSAEAGKGASHAAAGMLAAGVEVEPGEEWLLPLCLESQRLWPSFAAELEALSGERVDYRAEGTLVIALNRDDAEALRQRYEFQRSLGLSLSWLSGAQTKEREPFLHPRTVASVASAHDTQVDNRKVVFALRKLVHSLGGAIHEGKAVTSIDIEAGRARGIVVDEQHVRADVVVLAAGAWSRRIAGLPLDLPVRPVKGQMLSLRMSAEEPLLRHVVWAPKSYLVPRLDGRLIVGATTEEKGFDTSLTAGGVMALLEAAWRALPGIEELPIDELWTGLRPGSRDDAPILGPFPGVDGLIVATGHHRNGILLTPITAETISQLILMGKVDERIRPFSLDRFERNTGRNA